MSTSRVLVRLLALALCGAATASGSALQPSEAPHRQTRRLMGTLCEITVYHEDPLVAARAASAGLDEMQRVDRLLSNYDPTSELSAMNREASTAPFHASEELFAFVERSRRYFDETHGTFDPTVGPLVRAWGFLGSQPAKPSADVVAEARARSGFAKVVLDAAARTVRFTAAGLEFDPGGIGKGWAVDRAVARLRQDGTTSALVSAGGSTLFAIGRPAGREAWRIAVGDPSNVERPLRYVHLRDQAVSTSGVARRSVRDAGRRFSHIFDPRTGAPVEDMCQVSVVAPDATASDALTKAAYILNRDEVLALFTRLGRAYHVLRAEGPCGAGRGVWTTPWSATVFSTDANGTEMEAGRAAPARDR